MMKKFIVTMIIASTAFIANAQRSKVEDALRQIDLIPANYEKAVEYINEAKEHPDTKNDSKTYRAIGNIYMAIAGNKELAAKYPNAAYTGLEGYVKCMELNTSKFEFKTAKNVLFEKGAILTAYNLGSAAYNNKEYAQAVKYFELLIRAIPLDERGLLAKNQITEDYLHLLAAQAAQVAGLNKEAMAHYQSLMKTNPKDQTSYIAISQIHLEEGDTNAAFSIIEKGRTVMPDSASLREREIGLYQLAGRINELETKINDAIKKDPNSAILYSLRGDIHDSKGDQEKAIEDYKKAISLDSLNSIKAHNNIGAQYLKLAAPLIEKYNSPDIGFEEGNKLEEKIHGYYREAIPHFVFVAEHTDNIQIKHDALTTLRDLYKDIKDYDNFKKVQAEIEELENSQK